MALIFRFLKPYWKRCLLTVLVVVLDVAGTLFVPTIMADLINDGLAGVQLNEIVKSGLLMLAFSVLSGLGGLLGSWLCASLSAKIGRDMRNAIYDKSLLFSDGDFEKFGTGSMIMRTLNDVNVVQQAIVMCIQMILPVPVMVVLGIIFSFRINTNIGYLMLGGMAVLILVALVVILNASRIFAAMQKTLDKMNVVLRENITGTRVIRAFNKQDYEEERANQTFGKYATLAIKANNVFAGLDSIASLIINTSVVVIIWIGGNAVGAGEMLIGDISAVSQYALMILYYIMMAQMVVILLPRANVCARRMSDVLSLSPEITDGKGAVSEDNTDEIIRFENACFRFSDAEKDTLKDISFSCRRGETVAVIGGTGSGKSTIAKLLLRFGDVSSGRITLKNTDIRSIPQSELRSRVAYVPQKAWLFSGTIADNLRHGKQDATEEEMKRALEVAQAKFVTQLPDGLQSHVAQGGTNFSGGQKQRLSIARAIIKKADLYVFDDSFSALDFKTDAALRRALACETKNSAVLIVAQRVNTIAHADKIIVLDNGGIVGTGTHNELMENCAIYREIALSQMKGATT